MAPLALPRLGDATADAADKCAEMDALPSRLARRVDLPTPAARERKGGGEVPGVERRTASESTHRHHPRQPNGHPQREHDCQNHIAHGATGTPSTAVAGCSPDSLQTTGLTRNNAVLAPHPPPPLVQPALPTDALSPMHMTDRRSPSTPSWRSRCASSPARTPVRRPSLRMITGSVDADAADAARPRVSDRPVAGVAGGDGDAGVKARGSGDGAGDGGVTLSCDRGGDGGVAADDGGGGGVDAGAGAAAVPSGFAMGRGDRVGTGEPSDGGGGGGKERERRRGRDGATAGGTAASNPPPRCVRGGRGSTEWSFCPPEATRGRCWLASLPLRKG